MAKNKYAFARYRLIDNLLKKHTYVKSKDVVEACRSKLGCTITQRTIQMDIEAMRNDSFLGFYAPIAYEGKRKAYYYENTDFVLMPLQFSTSEYHLIHTIIQQVKDDASPEINRALTLLAEKIKLLTE